jgi:hypothetical protein
MMTRTEQRSNLEAASRRLLDLTVVWDSSSAVDLLPPSSRRLEDVDIASTCFPSSAGNLLLIRM